jgi:hypothetical protein
MEFSMPAHEFGFSDMIGAWVFMAVTFGAGLGVGRLLYMLGRRPPR